MAARARDIEPHPPAALLDLPLTVALRADARRFEIPASLTVCAGVRSRDVQSQHCPTNRLPEADRDLVLEIAALFRFFPRPCRRAAAAEHIGKNVAKTAARAAAALAASAFEQVRKIEA